MVAQLSRLGLLVIVAACALGCSGDDAGKMPEMNTPSAANGPKLDDWAKANPNNGAPGHEEADKK